MKHGVVQDKLWLPGLLKLKTLRELGFFGGIFRARRIRLLGVRRRHHSRSAAVVELSQGRRRRHHHGHAVPLALRARQSLRPVKAVSCLGATHIPQRWDEAGNPYDATADDAAYATFELEDGIVAHFNSSWCVRVRRDDLLTIQVDGTKGTAVAGLRHCWIQPSGATPRPVWNPDIDNPLDYFDDWQKVPEQDNLRQRLQAAVGTISAARRAEGDLPWSLLEGAKGVQLAERGMESWKKRAWVPIPDLR